MEKTKRLTPKDLGPMTREELISMLLESDRKVGLLEAKEYSLNKKLMSARAKIERQLEVIRKFGIERFVTKGETLPESPINEAEACLDAGDSAANGKPKAKRGRKKGSRNFEGWDLERRSRENPVVYDTTDEACPSCGGELVHFGNDYYFELSVMPERVIVIKHIRKKMRCKECGEIVNALSGAPFGHSPISASFAASVAEKKLELGIPLDRQARKLTDLGLPTTTQLLSETFLRASDLLKPVWDEVVGALSSTECGVINADETPVKVLDERKAGRLKSQVFVYASSWFEHPMAVYDFSISREMAQTKEILKGFRGTVICDGYVGYEELAAESEGAIGLQCCWSHSRRYWFDAWKAVPKESRSRSQARPVVEAFDAVFAKEREMRDAAMPPSEVVKERNSPEYLALLSALKSAVDAADPLAGAKLAAAKRYFDNHWDSGMRTFLSDGHVDISNNLALGRWNNYADMLAAPPRRIGISRMNQSA